MKVFPNLKLFVLVGILAGVLIFIGISFIQAQVKTQGKPPRCNYNGICEKGESKDCPDCQQPEPQELIINQLGLQIASGGYLGGGHDKVYQIKYLEAEGYKNTWTSNSFGSNTIATSIGDADNDGWKEIITVVDVKYGHGKKEKKYQKILLFEDGAFQDPSWKSPDLGYSLNGVRDSVIADADNDGKNEILLVKNKRIEIYRITYDEILQDYYFEYLWSSPDHEYFIWSMDVGDADNDLENEVVLAIFGIGSAIVYEFLGGDTWGNPNITQSLGAYNIDFAKVRDADNDGLNEIIAGGTSNSLNIWKYKDGIYVNVFLSHDLGGYTQGGDAGDVDGDGKNEVIVGTSSGGAGSVYAFEYDNENDTYVTLDSIPNSGVGCLSVGDLDGDGTDEIASSTSGITIYKLINGSLYFIKNLPILGALDIG